jgi:DNA-binding transcriptional MerR regulator
MFSPSHSNPWEVLKMEEEDKTCSLGAAAKVAGIPGYMLRQWCDRYLHHIKRIKIGEFQFQRRFTGQDIELIRRIKEYRRTGFTLGAAVTQARQDLDGGKE